MGVDQMVSLFGNSVFPVAMCIILCYYINTTQQQLTGAINELRETMIEIKQQIGMYHKNEDK